MKKIIIVLGILIVIAVSAIIGFKAIKSNKTEKSESSVTQNEKEKTTEKTTKQEDEENPRETYTTGTTGDTYVLQNNKEVEVGYMGEVTLEKIDDRLEVLESGWSKLESDRSTYCVSLGVKVKNIGTETLAVFPSFVCKDEQGVENTVHLLEGLFTEEVGECRPSAIIPPGSTALIGKTLLVGGAGAKSLGLSKTLDFSLTAVEPYIEVSDTFVEDFTINLEENVKTSAYAFKGTIAYNKDDIEDKDRQGGNIQVVYYKDGIIIGGDTGHFDVRTKDKEETLRFFGIFSGPEYDNYELDARLYGGNNEWSESLFREYVNPDFD